MAETKDKPKAAKAAKATKAAKPAKAAKATTKAVKAAEEVRPRLRIKIRAYDHKIIDTAARQIVDAALRQSAEVLGPVPLPTEFRRYTVNKSTFVHKDARDQFEMRVHRRLIDIPSPTPKLIDALMALTLPAGVDTEIKTL
jgi:small subunit ribosomal protein S10